MRKMCPECCKELSGKEKKCPNCGIIFGEPTSYETQQNYEVQQNTQGEAGTLARLCKITALIMGVICFFLGLAFASSGGGLLVLLVWFGGFTSCLLLYSVGEILSQLVRLNNK